MSKRTTFESGTDFFVLKGGEEEDTRFVTRDRVREQNSESKVSAK